MIQCELDTSRYYSFENQKILPVTYRLFKEKTSAYYWR